MKTIQPKIHTVRRIGNVALLMAAISLVDLAAVSQSRAQSPDYPQVLVNQNPVNFTGQTPVEINGHLLVPLRGVLETMGAYVDFDSATQTVLASEGQTRISLAIGASQATVNGQSISLDVPAEILNGSTMVPLRFVAEALGANVRYDAAAHVVSIDTQQAQQAPPPVSAGTSVRGIISAVYSQVDPPRIVVQPIGTDGTADQTIPLRFNTALALERPGTPPEPISLDQINVGSTVAVLVESDGTASEVNVIVPAIRRDPPRLFIPPDPGTTIMGTVVGINPPRLIIQPAGTDGSSNITVLVRPNAALTIQQPDSTQQPISFGQIFVGAPVAILAERDGDALAVNLIAPPPPQGPQFSLAFHGGLLGFRESDHDTFILRLGDGRQQEVPKTGAFKGRPADPGSTMLGTVVAIYSRINPQRIVVQPAGTNGNSNRTILLHPNAAVTVQQIGGQQQPISLDRISPGAAVAILTEHEGDALAVNVILPQPKPNVAPQQQPRPNFAPAPQARPNVAPSQPRQNFTPVPQARPNAAPAPQTRPSFAPAPQTRPNFPPPPQANQNAAPQQTRPNPAPQARPNAATAPQTNPNPVPQPARPNPAPPAARPNPAAPASSTFKGVIREFHDARVDTYIVTTTDGRQIEVQKRAPVFLNGHLIRWNDMRPGQPVTITVEPKSGRGTQVLIVTPH